MCVDEKEYYEPACEKLYVSKIEGSSHRGRPLGRCQDGVKEYMYVKRGDGRGEGLEQARSECLDRERWRLFCDHPLRGYSQKKKESQRPNQPLSIA